MTGTTTVQKASFTFSGSRFAPIMSHVNASVDHVERPLMTPDEIMRLKPPKKEGDGAAERITEPGAMLVFVSGHYPILGMQMLFFFDPIFQKRAALPPPAPASISGGRLLSPPEDVPGIGAESEMERAFVARLERDDEEGS
jgi:type IV secretion system protein VirD4